MPLIKTFPQLSRRRFDGKLCSSLSRRFSRTCPCWLIDTFLYSLGKSDFTVFKLWAGISYVCIFSYFVWVLLPLECVRRFWAWVAQDVDKINEDTYLGVKTVEQKMPKILVYTILFIIPALARSDLTSSPHHQKNPKKFVPYGCFCQTGVNV